jgi:hypothetical protein
LKNINNKVTGNNGKESIYSSMLSEGDYRFEAIINSYYVNSSDSQYYGSVFINDTVVFHLAAPK